MSNSKSTSTVTARSHLQSGHADSDPGVSDRDLWYLAKLAGRLCDGAIRISPVESSRSKYVDTYHGTIRISDHDLDDGFGPAVRMNVVVGTRGVSVKSASKRIRRFAKRTNGRVQIQL